MIRSRLVLFCVISCFYIASASALPAADPIAADVLLSGGTLYDGAGGPGVVGDIAIRGDKIVAVGKFEVGLVGTTIDCRGLIVAPGFIDLHNHSDAQIIDRKTRANVNFLTQGCTTVVTGNCGSGPVDAGEYYKQIETLGAGTNIVHLLPQGSLRQTVFGAVRRVPTAEESKKMRELTAKAMQDGVWGMSTGLIYVPSSYAHIDELVDIAKVVGEHGGIYASHIRGEGVDLLKSVREALDIGKRAGLPVHVSHFKSSGRDAWGLVRQAIEMIETARKADERVTADQYPYVASSTSLEATLIPTWAREGDHKALLARLDDAEHSVRIRDFVVAHLKKNDEGEALFIARYAPRPDWVGKNLAEIARQEKSTPLETALTITRNGGAQIVNFNMSEDDVRQVMQLPWVATASDGRAWLPNAERPHPRSYGTFPRKIGQYALRDKVVPLELAIRSASGLPADILGIPERGYLRTGHFADVVVIDPKEFIDTATFAAPHQYARGVRQVFVNGEPALLNGTITGALAGRPLRHVVKK